MHLAYSAVYGDHGAKQSLLCLCMRIDKDLVERTLFYDCSCALFTVN